jgi:hypothetical protein
MIGFMNLGCAISWAVLVALEGSINKWYHTHSMPPSELRVVVIMAAITIALGMDCTDLYLHLQIKKISVLAQRLF